MSTTPKRVLRLTPVNKLIISTVVTIITYFILKELQMNNLYLFLILWIVFAFHYMIFSWIVIFTRTTEEIKYNASKDDGSRTFVFIMIFITCAISFLIVLLLMSSKDISFYKDYRLVSGAVIAMILSWSMLHTTYIFHYAHEYYGMSKNDLKKGLDFPNNQKPDYLDFAYFAFCIGTTFQVSDVEITSKSIRRVVLLHGLISFFINTIVVALTINLVAGLVK